jgi:hypothetical protein
MTVQLGTYAHMCRDGHVQIGHRDGEHEQCPLCRVMSALQDAYDYIEVNDDGTGERQRRRLLETISAALKSVSNGDRP